MTSWMLFESVIGKTGEGILWGLSFEDEEHPHASLLLPKV